MLDQGLICSVYICIYVLYRTRNVSVVHELMKVKMFRFYFKMQFFLTYYFVSN